MTPAKTLYFDFNATTPVDPRVLETMLPYFSTDYGNSMSTTHSFGWTAEAAVEKARGQAAALFGCEPKELTFTSGATESNNWALEGLVEAIRTEEGPQAKIHFLISPVEHSSVLQAARRMERLFQVEVDLLPINAFGQVEVAKIQSLIKPHTRLLAAMWVQNEVGSINPTQDLVHFCREHKIYLLSDATQAAGKIPVNLKETKVDLLSFSAHKLFGPKGVGLFYQRSKDPRVQIPALIAGGGHEQGARSGTLNVPAIVGMGKACELAMQEAASEIPALKGLRDSMWEQIRSHFPQARLNGHPTERAPNNLHITFVGSSIPASLRGLAVSRGSACMSGKTSISHVLLALGFSDDEAATSLRISLGRFTTTDQVSQAVALLQQQIKPRQPLLNP